jgi:hypothetical protein
MTLPRELLPLIDELLSTEIRRRAGSFKDSEAARRANQVRWSRVREAKTAK